jgi:hypothetical protein
MESTLALPIYMDDLGNGLFRRWSTAADEAKIGACLATVFRGKPDEPPNQTMINRMAVLFNPGQPLMGPGDYAVVEDTSRAERPIVACACLWRHCWSYGGIPFGLGRPEYVATLPEYRNRGLIRAVFEMLHARSAARGDLVQAITGIPYYYRQFGYEYALDLGGGRTIPVAAIPVRKGEEPELCHLRPALESDVREIKTLYDHQAASSLVWTEMTEERWRYYITVWDLPAVQRQAPGEFGPERRLFMIVDGADKVCGVVGLATSRRKGTAYIGGLVMAPNVNWQAAMPSLLRAFVQAAADIPDADLANLAGATPEPVRELVFNLDRFHPAIDIWGDRLASTRDPPYAWYVRVADLPRFLHHIAPVLERRLAGSLLAGYTGELKLDFYRGGLRLQFEKGKMIEAAPWRVPPYGDEEQGGCPPLVFLQLLFGRRSLAELRDSYPDVWTTAEAALLVDTLFPKQPSSVWSLSYT